MPKGKTITPMMQQYLAIKEKNQDSILFFRMGDFYEMFFEDAEEASRIMNVALTSRSRSGDDRIPMCGVPYHSATGYISKLLRAGRKVAICEQVEDPKAAKGLVKREIVRLISPGLTLEESDLDERSNNYLAAVLPGNGTRSEGSYGFTVTDLSTGEFRIGQVEALDELIDELARLAPAEILLPEEARDDMSLSRLVEACRPRLANYLDRGFFDRKETVRRVDEQFPGQLPDTVEEDSLDLAVRCAGSVLEYLHQTQMTEAVHLQKLEIHRTESHMILDEATFRNLELFSNIAEGGKAGSLLWHMDRTATAMGARKLKKWLQYPLVNLEAIGQRLDAVGELVTDPVRAKKLRDALVGVMDLERLVGRICLASGNAKDLVNLKASLLRVPEVRSALADCPSELLERILSRLDPMDDVTGLIEKAIRDEPPFVLRDGGLIKDGFDDELDELISISRDGKSWIAAMETRERERTGIAKLRVRFNKVFGYFIEVTRSHLDQVPEDYERKQTLVNAERFITPELKEYEEKVLHAEERRCDMEYDLFTRVRLAVAAEGGRIQAVADHIAQLDVLLSLAETAVEYRYCRPQVDAGQVLAIEEGRHPVVERLLTDEPFVPNDTYLDRDTCQLVILTGPNMAGKSTYIRQVALIALMAQIGSFVPAKNARIGIADRIFTRVGASDNLARGKSTFMVEMTETANILRNASPKSLIILDEIGRGTSTFDGVSIAWAVAEALHDDENLQARTLFATHYHELTELMLTKTRVKNLSIAVKEWNDQIIFLRRIIEGGANRSYGIQVGRLAGLPSAVVNRAKEILANLEKGELDEMGMPRLARPGKPENQKNTGQLHLFAEPAAIDPVRGELDALDVETLTPIEALNLIHQWKKGKGS